MNEECIFCRIAEGNYPAKVVLRTEHAVSFHDIEPKAPVHVLVVPNVHVENLAACDQSDLLGGLLAAVRETAKELGLEEGYRVVTNVGHHGGQTVGHLHFHIMGGRNMGWPPG